MRDRTLWRHQESWQGRHRDRHAACKGRAVDGGRQHLQWTHCSMNLAAVNIIVRLLGRRRSTLASSSATVHSVVCHVSRLRGYAAVVCRPSVILCFVLIILIRLWLTVTNFNNLVSYFLNYLSTVVGDNSGYIMLHITLDWFRWCLILTLAVSRLSNDVVLFWHCVYTTSRRHVLYGCIAMRSASDK